MAYDIFHKYGFDSIDDNRSLEDMPRNRFIKSEYDDALRLIDKDMNDLQTQYLNGDKSPSEILVQLGYEESSYNEHIYEKVYKDETFVVDFIDYDYDDGPINYYVTDFNGRIPSGYTRTRMILEDPDISSWENEGCELPQNCSRKSDVVNEGLDRFCRSMLRKSK